jgi:hypothetical protein
LLKALPSIRVHRVFSGSLIAHPHTKLIAIVGLVAPRHSAMTLSLQELFEPREVFFPPN